MAKLDAFTTAYIMAAFWSSTEYPFGTCPKCGKPDRILCRWLERVTPAGKPRDVNDSYVCADCSEQESTEEPPMDRNYSITDLAPETLSKMVEDCAAFQAAHGELFTSEHCLRYGPDTDGSDGRAGHDFWLTRNGHGAGFWDGDWAEPAATTLTDASKAFGEFNLYVGDDGRIYHTS